MHEKTVEVPLEDWVRQIVKETSTIAVEEAIKMHKASCPLINMNILGNGKPSWDIRIDRLERVVKIATYLLSPVYLIAIGTIISKVVQYFV